MFTAGLTPIPYKVFTNASGVTGLSLVPFAVGSLASRGLRFYLDAALLRHYGPPIRAFLEGHLGKVTAAFMVLLVGGFAVARWLA